MPGPTQQRQQEKRDAKLRSIRQQVADGQLVIRQMTAAERKRFPPRTPAPSRAASKR